ncbi:MAG: AMP-binding protein [Aeromonas sp.]
MGSLVCPVRARAHLTPHAPAMYCQPDRWLNYAALDAHLNALCAQLQAHGLSAGDTLVARVRGAQNDVLLAWACLRLQVRFCPLNPALVSAQQAQLAEQLGADAFYAADGAPAGAWRVLTLDFAAQQPAAGSDWPLNGEALCNVIFSSGSSGQPKAVVHRVRHHVASARGAASLIALDAGSAWLLSLPLFHIGGYAILFRVFFAGAALVLDDRRVALKTRLETLPITHLSLVPTQLWRLLNDGFMPARTRVRELLLGGAAIPAPLVARLQALGLTPKVSYGLSEMASQVCSAAPSAAGVVGRPLPRREVCVIDDEICVRGDTLFAGYWRAGKLVLPLDSSGWFHTRDKGALLADGQLRVDGRLDNVFISGGENIQPETIEQRLVDHPRVAQALVVPVASAEWGARPVAFIDWQEAPVAWPELVDWLRAALPGFMVPDAWLPWRGQSGLKPARREWAASAASALAAMPAARVDSTTKGAAWRDC